jgi:zinc finger protein
MESYIEQSCPICGEENSLKMLAHTSEIPYFGEHTQITMSCQSCGWRVTDFIPAEGKKAGSWKLVVNSTEHISSRVVRSSSCTVRIEELGLEVSPGSSSTGYISNVEGVLDRFSSAIGTIRLQAESEEDDETLSKCDELLSRIDLVKNGELVVTLELLDPVGHSQILHEEAVSSEISDKDARELDPGPVYPVFDVSSE